MHHFWPLAKCVENGLKVGCKFETPSQPTMAHTNKPHRGEKKPLRCLSSQRLSARFAVRPRTWRAGGGRGGIDFPNNFWRRPRLPFPFRPFPSRPQSKPRSERRKWRGHLSPEMPLGTSPASAEAWSWENAAAGAAAGFTTVAALHPLDVVRTRFQGNPSS